MRLRQIALASRRLDAVQAELEETYGLRPAYNDPHIIHYGLRNVVMPAGRSFIEIVEPVRPDASAGRFLDRCGGDAGYMVILQTEDAPAATARAVGLGARVVDTIDRPDYFASHFHPADFGGVLVSFDQQRSGANLLEDYGDWMPAGPDWRAARTDRVRDLTAVTIACADSEAMTQRWAALLDVKADGFKLPLAMGEIRFVQAEAGARTSIASIDLTTAADTRDARIGGVLFKAAPA